MRLFTRRRQPKTKSTQPVDGWRRVGDFFTGAWQQARTPATTADLLQYPALFACIDRIGTDMSTMPFRVMQRDSAGIPRRVSGVFALGILANPNGYQTPAQFRRAWIASKLIHGNTLVLRAGDELHVLDWSRVQVLVSESGSVYYRLQMPSAQNLLPARYGTGEVTIPASAVIHDRDNCLYHPLIGVPPVTAAALASEKNTAILQASADAFRDGNRQPGVLSVPAGLSEEEGKRLKALWDSTAGDTVRLIGADAKFTEAAQTGADAQAVEHLTASDRQIAQCFRIPPSLLGIEALPAGLKIGDQLRQYLKLCLLAHIQGMETLLTRILTLPGGMWVSLDTDILLRMDPAERATVWGGLVESRIATTNEARSMFDLPPVAGGDDIRVQLQDVPLSNEAHKND